jgi:predicted nucleic acid-binding protein
MRVLLDSNVILDVLLAREPWVAEASDVWRGCLSGAIQGYITATSVTDIYYLSRRQVGHARAIAAIAECLSAFQVLAVAGRDLELAIERSGTDFEDDLQAVVAERAGLDAIVTRDANGFSATPVPVWTPRALLERMR